MTSLTELGGPATDGTATVVVFPHAGGSPRFFLPWRDRLPATYLLGVTYPGRDHRMDAPPAPSLRALAAEVATELAARAEARPVTLVGHSLGGWIAYETAVRLAASTAAEDLRLVVSGQNPPTVRPDTALHAAPDDALIEDVVRQNPGNAEIWTVPELCRLFLPSVRQDYRLLETYVPSLEVVPRIQVVLGDEDREVCRERTGEWARFSREPLVTTEVAGPHFYLAPPDTQLPSLLGR